MNINGMNALSSDGGEKDEKFWKNAVRLVEQRLGLLASNIANADTPNYKARDIDFSSALKQAMTNSKLPVLSRVRHGPQGSTRRCLSTLPISDATERGWNTVDVDQESAAFSLKQFATSSSWTRQ
jgi:flagellar basal-body rod protein FlgB